MKRVGAIGLACVFTFPTIANGQGDVCAKIVDHGLNNIAIATNVEAFTDRLYWRFCNEGYERLTDEKKAEFGITVKTIPMSLGAQGSSDSQKHTKFCGDYRTRTDQFSSQAIYTNRMHDKAIDAWRSCIETTRKQLYIDYTTPASQRYTDVSMKYIGPPGTTKFNGIEQSEIACTFDGKPIDAGTKFDLAPAEKTVRCERKGYPQDVGGVQATYFPAAGVTIKTDAGNSSYEFIEMIEGPARERFRQLDVKIAGVEDRSRAFRELLAAKWGGPEVRGPMVGGNPGMAETVCPDGKYAVGVAERGSGGGYCNGCLDRIQVICRPLPKN